ncbi:MAG TPA: hypothetical protein VHC69_16860 [Polyangiaceae bacterium]|nr:hypothetical protein [Polyangiaceae bacterium]
MTLDKMWETAQTQAAQVKLAQADQGTSPSSVWPAIESDLDLLQSAFATEQVTWESAKKKATQLQQAIQDLGAPTSSTMQSLRDSVTKAVSMQGDLEKSCRF